MEHATMPDPLSRLDQARAVLHRATRAIYDLVEWARLPASAVSSPLVDLADTPDRLLGPLGPCKPDPLRDVMRGHDEQARLGTEERLSEFFAVHQELLRALTEGHTLDHLIAARPIDVAWADPSVAAWLTLTAIRIADIAQQAAGLDRLRFAGGKVAAEDCRRMVQAWYVLCPQLAALDLPEEAEVWKALERECAAAIDRHVLAQAAAPAEMIIQVIREEATRVFEGTSTNRDGPNQDGPVPPRSLWLKGQEYKIGKGPKSRKSSQLLQFFWKRECVTFESLQGVGCPWQDPVADRTIVSAINRFNQDVPADLPWRLTTGEHCVLKVPKP
jgi:hypothetical protein